MKQLSLIAVLFLFFCMGMNAQVTIGSSRAPSKFSLLELDATTVKGGLHLPRLTTAERDALLTTGADTLAAKGQFVYNIDNDCLNFWDGSDWKELCNSSTTPEVEINDCGKIRKYGKYSKGAPLNNTHYITLPVKVTKKGSYSIIASSGNGYYFQANGVFEEENVIIDLRLDGMGTPNNNGTDEITFTCNGKIIGCSINITVDSQTMGYQVDCENIEVFGEYPVVRFTDGGNYVNVPVEVLAGGLASFETNMVNGLRFTCSQTLNQPGSDILVLKAQGKPTQAGKYTFTFTTNGSVKTTCSFVVECTSTLGTFADPARKCLDVYNENPMAPNGEYWLKYGDNADVVRTYCDIAGGGWTLVWSYSEKTAYDIYRNGSSDYNSIAVPAAQYSAFIDNKRGRITSQAGNDNGPTAYKINYNDFRLSRLEWQNYPINTSTPQIKVRIATSPTDMTDEWGQNNYGILSPHETYYNPIATDFNGYRGFTPTVGKIYGIKWEIRRSGGGTYGGWNEPSGTTTDMALYNGGGYTTHWNWNNYGSTTQIQVFPNPGRLSGGDNSIAVNNINNAFGWFGETQQNHHFGKCTNDDYSFSTKTCDWRTLRPHSFNNGEGRYCQWFVK